MTASPRESVFFGPVMSPGRIGREVGISRSRIVLMVLLLGASACCRSGDQQARAPRPAATSSTSAASPAGPSSSSSRVESDWCSEAVEALDEETCFVLPKEVTDTLLVYFHGIVPPSRESPQKTNYQTVVANAARRGKVAALLPRGRRGLAPAGHEGWWGWPTTEAAYREHAHALVDAVLRKRAALEAVAGVAFARSYVAGSSSGAYFVAMLALSGGIAADGFAVLSGGAGRPTAELARLEPRPVYIGYGTQDSVGSSARALGELLQRAGWPVRVASHPVGHGAREVYLDEAFRFFGVAGGVEGTSPGAGGAPER